MRDEVNTGPVRIHSRLLSIPAIPSSAPMLIEKRTGLIVVAQIALLRPRLEGGQRKPYVISLVLANKFGRVLTVFDSGPQEAVMPAGVIDHEGRHATIDEMRQAILKCLGNNNALVGFHLGWTLTALNLSLPACRVVDLGTEEAYQLLCFKMASNSPVWKTLLYERLAHSLDRSIPAMFYQGGIDLNPKGQHDIIGEAYYTATIWNIIEPAIVAQRLRASTYRLKCAYSLGQGYALELDELKLLSKPRSIVERLGAVPLASLECTQAEVLAMLEEAPILNMPWHGDHGAFLRQCWEMAREYGPRLPRCSDDVPVYPPELERCNMAVDVALPSQAVTGPAKLLVP